MPTEVFDEECDHADGGYYSGCLVCSNARLLAEVEGLKPLLPSLVAAVSLLKQGGKKAAPSDTIFNMMIADYEKAIDSARAALRGGEA